MVQKPIYFDIGVKRSLASVLVDSLNDDVRFSSVFTAAVNHDSEEFVNIIRIGWFFRLVSWFGFFRLFVRRPVTYSDYYCCAHRSIGYFFVRSNSVLFYRYDSGVELIISFDDLDLDIIIKFFDM